MHSDSSVFNSTICMPRTPFRVASAIKVFEAINRCAVMASPTIIICCQICLMGFPSWEV